MTTPTRPAAYLRLSITRDDSVSIEGQRRIAEGICAARGWPAPEFYIDEGVSGSKDIARPARDELERAIVEGRHDALIVKSVDRLARSTADFARLAKVCKDAGCVLVVSDLSVDTSSPAGSLVLDVMAALAAWEAAQIGARVAQAHEVRARQGKAPAGPPPYGFANVDHPDGGRVRVIDEEAAVVIRERMIAPLLAGESLRSIAKSLNDAGVLAPGDHLAKRLGRPRRGGVTSRWSATMIKAVLTNPALAGMQRRKGDVLRGDDGLPRVLDAAVVDLGTWRQIQAALARRSGADAKQGKPHSERLLLQGLAVCASCGGPMKRQTHRRNAPLSYTCSYVPDHRCTAGATIAVHVLDAYVTAEVLRRYGPFRITRPVEAADPAIVERLAHVREEIQATLDAMATASPADVAELATRLAGLKSAETAALADLEGAPIVTLEETDETFAEEWTSADHARHRELLASLIIRVEVARGRKAEERVRIVWRGLGGA